MFREALRFILPSLAATTCACQAALVWQVGLNDNAWPLGDGGGANASFVQENGVVNPLPGNPTSPEINGQADNDYYFAGTYTSTIPSVVAFYGAYAPAGIIAANEEAAERAHAAGDFDLRFHFNLPTTLASNHTLTVTFDALNLDVLGGINTDPRFGNEIYFNGILVQPEIIIRAGQLDTDMTSAPFTLASVNAQTGPGADNIISLRGLNYLSDGGGNWMGVDYIRLDSQIPEPTSALMVLLGAVGMVPFLCRRRG